ncbi:MAG: hypothetical protein QM740_19155 [Acidovorax sp.]
MSDIVKTTTMPVSMDSKEIASLLEKEHSNVLRDTRVMLIGLYGDDYLSMHMPPNYAGGRNAFIQANADAIFRAVFEDDSVLNHQQRQGFTWKRDARGYLTKISLDKSHTMTLVSGYDVKLRKRIVDRLQVLEEAAAPKAIAYSVGQHDTLTVAQQDELRGVLHDGAERLPMAQRGAFLQKGWSKLKAHFKVSYREIPRREFTEALSIAARHVNEHATPAALPVPQADPLHRALDSMHLMAESMADLAAAVAHLSRGSPPQLEKGEGLNGGNRQPFGEAHAVATAKASVIQNQ